MKYNAVIFDLDGTLVYTPLECTRYLAKKAFGEFGINLSDEEADYFWFSHKREDFIGEKGLDVETFWDVYRKHDTYEFRKPSLKLYEDAGIIQEAKSKGYKTGIVTGAPLHIILLSQQIIGRQNLDCSIRAQKKSGFEPKPNPQALIHCIESIGAKSPETIYVGNGDEDVLVSRAAGVLDVIIERGEHDLMKETPSLRIKSLYELRDFL
ncbi:MAG: HAD family hydrolase [Candidatus Aenigmarchaeota archaeon]|nr:HAD family hydrolase [Candidatus Aenigmarchaeota archaeon]